MFTMLTSLNIQCKSLALGAEAAFVSNINLFNSRNHHVFTYSQLIERNCSNACLPLDSSSILLSEMKRDTLTDERAHLKSTVHSNSKTSICNLLNNYYQLYTLMDSQLRESFFQCLCTIRPSTLAGLGVRTWMS